MEGWNPASRGEICLRQVKSCFAGWNLPTGDEIPLRGVKSHLRWGCGSIAKQCDPNMASPRGEAVSAADGWGRPSFGRVKKWNTGLWPAWNTACGSMKYPFGPWNTFLRKAWRKHCCAMQSKYGFASRRSCQRSWLMRCRDGCIDILQKKQLRRTTYLSKTHPTPQFILPYHLWTTATPPHPPQAVPLPLKGKAF